jgi:hypothetical protein
MGYDCGYAAVSIKTETALNQRPAGSRSTPAGGATKSDTCASLLSLSSPAATVLLPTHGKDQRRGVLAGIQERLGPCVRVLVHREADREVIHQAAHRLGVLG